MYTYAFDILKAYLSAVVPELREIDWYLQQDSATDKNVGVYTAPALYLEFSLVGQLRNHGGRIQSGLTTLTVHLVTENVYDTGKRVKKSVASDHMAIFDKVYKNLQGFSTKLSAHADFIDLLNTADDQRLFNSLSRTSMVVPQQYRKGLMKSQQQFEAIFYDHAAIRTYTRITPDLVINPDLEFAVNSIFDDTFDETFN